MDHERRVWVRYPCNATSMCQPSVGAVDVRWPARVRDISCGGIKLVVERRFEIGTILNIEIPVRGGLETSVIARVVHVGKDQSGRWSIGCRFAQTLPDSEVQAIAAEL